MLTGGYADLDLQSANLDLLVRAIFLKPCSNAINCITKRGHNNGEWVLSFLRT